jgi:hypothetical protein
MKRLKKGEALMLRTCNADGTSYGGFRWPRSGPVTCSDWNPEAKCGNGLHGLLWGEGDGSALNWSEDAAWLVVRIIQAEAVEIGQKIKVPSGVVEFFGAAHEAVVLIQSHAPAGTVVVGGTATAGDWGTATAGYGGCISILYWNGVKYKRAVFAVGKGGLEPNQPYTVDETGAPQKKVKP